MWRRSYGQKLWVLQIEAISTDSTQKYLAIILGVRPAMHTLDLQLIEKPLKDYKIWFLNSLKSLLNRERGLLNRERQKKTEKATTSQIKMLQQQFSSFIQTEGIIPPCLGDAVRATKGLGPLDDFSTDDDMEDDDKFDDDDF